MGAGTSLLSDSGILGRIPSLPGDDKNESGMGVVLRHRVSAGNLRVIESGRIGALRTHETDAAEEGCRNPSVEGSVKGRGYFLRTAAERS
jgi:hypothetical protein